MNLSDSESLLKKALTDLQTHWLNAGAGWQDKARETFEKDHLEPMRFAAENARHGMRNVDALLRQVIRECS